MKALKESDAKKRLAKKKASKKATKRGGKRTTRAKGKATRGIKGKSKKGKKPEITTLEKPKVAPTAKGEKSKRAKKAVQDKVVATHGMQTRRRSRDADLQQSEKKDPATSGVHTKAKAAK